MISPYQQLKIGLEQRQLITYDKPVSYLRSKNQKAKGERIYSNNVLCVQARIVFLCVDDVR